MSAPTPAACSAMPKIDLHAHVVPDKWPNLKEAKPEHALDFSRLQNDFVASLVRRRPDRFVGLCTLPMQGPQQAVEELKRCVSQLGFRAVIIGSHVNEWTLGDRALDPFYRRANNTNPQALPRIICHAGMPAETTAAICEVMFGGVLERFPRLKLCFAHGAGSLPYTIGRIQHGFDVRPDLVAVDNKVPPKDYLGKIYADSLVHNYSALRLLLETLGEGSRNGENRAGDRGNVARIDGVSA
ncbi:hypothetical protein HPB48_008690 [Haemaphysalis longicornis]|uniref:2-amino-3-carboxymuconate-6-semialdehyde decarboxylase n=1 Tax=Haemaphysalis longicornis TaxID=44386 RepID=A0A9J6FWD7_HAELO|nr:hypothetical protein HPB48_008690 [Haemaphysalis longicornis]